MIIDGARAKGNQTASLGPRLLYFKRSRNEMEAVSADLISAIHQTLTANHARGASHRAGLAT